VKGYKPAEKNKKVRIRHVDGDDEFLLPLKIKTA